MVVMVCGLVGLAGLLGLFSFFGMWSVPKLSSGGLGTELRGLFGDLPTIGEEMQSKFVMADVFALIGFIVACLFAAVLVLHLLKILKDKKIVKLASMGLGALMFILGLLTMIFAIGAMNATGSTHSDPYITIGFGGWLNFFGMMIGGLAAIAFGYLLKGKKGKRR